MKLKMGAKSPKSLVNIYFACPTVCLYPINIEAAKPFGPKFGVGPHMTTGKGY